MMGTLHLLALSNDHEHKDKIRSFFRELIKHQLVPKLKYQPLELEDLVLQLLLYEIKWHFIHNIY